jgi:hypothetical protein
MSPRPRLLRIALWIALATVLTPGPLPAQQTTNRLPNLYILSFNRWGELKNPAELELAMVELEQQPGIERIIIFSYGWANDGEASYHTYSKLIEAIAAHAPTDRPRPSSAVIAVGWDSSQTGFRKLFNNVIPFPGIANAMAWLPDKLLFPISFWSKSAQADRIGFGGLRAALNRIFALYAETPNHPDVYLIGHSFGTRILSGLMTDQLGGVAVGGEPFIAAHHVRGAVLLQPALVSGNLDYQGGYPILVTMSRHDHANGFLYPIANIFLNSYGFTLFEALVQRRLLAAVEKGVGTVTDVVTAPLPGTPGAPEVVGRTAHLGRRSVGELLAFPLTLGFTLIATPVGYAYVQVRGLVTRPVGHIMDTLAQIPIVEIPVEGLDRLLGREVLSGQRSKGLFTLGPVHDAVGRMVAPRMLGPDDPRVYGLAELSDVPPAEVFAVDASEIVKQGIYGLDLGKSAVDFTIGWLDPIGAHSDYTNREVVRLMSYILNPPDSP